MTDSSRKVRAVVAAALLVCSLAGAGLTLTGSVAAANEPTATLDSVDVSVVAGGGNVPITYTATDETSVQSATVQFIDKDANSIVKGVDVDPTKSSATLTAPTSNGSYNVQLTVTDGDGNTVTSDVTEVVVDTEGPAVGIKSPDEGAQRTDAPTLTAKAVDNVAVSTVEFRIQRNGKNYTGSSWTANDAWVSATKNDGVWEYDAPTDNGTYTVVARATDGVGHTTNSTDVQPDSTQPVPGEDGEISYTLDPDLPTLTNLTVTPADEDGVVAVGESVTISANASDTTTSVETVTVDASALGESQSLALTNTDGDTWETTFTVGSLTVPDGPHKLTATATDSVGQEATNTSAEFTIDTAAASVGNVTIDAEFVGIVEDGPVHVTATDIRDGNGNLVDVGTVDIEIAGRTPFDSVEVDSGEIDTTIDPTKLGNDTTPLGEDVEVDIAGTGTTDTTVQLAHEVATMDAGWHVGGTPLPARDVLVSGNGTITTYDQAASNNWTVVGTDYMTKAGSGYYFNITSEEARVGYVFDETATTRTWELSEGSHLVGTVSKVGTGEENTTVSTLTNYVNDPTASDLDRVEFHVRKEPFGDGLVGFEEVSAGSNQKLPAYSAYYIDVTSSGSDPITYTVGWDGYSPE